MAAASGPGSGWPTGLDAYQPCIINRTLRGVRDDASGLTWDPEGAWWLVSGWCSKDGRKDGQMDGQTDGRTADAWVVS